MKKLVLFAVSVLVVMAACKNKGQTAEADESDSTVVGDSIVAQPADTAPQPMFLYVQDREHMQMVYWTSVKEPKKSDDFDSYEFVHESWALQEMFRRNASQYTTMVTGDGRIVAVKYLDELLTNPDGEEMFTGELHSRLEIPSPGVRYACANNSDFSKRMCGMNVIVCDNYLKSRTLLGYKDLRSSGEKKLSQNVVKKMEQKYGMKAERSVEVCKIADRYTFGAIQFKGEYKNAPQQKGEDNIKHCLAIELLVDGDTVYPVEVLGYYDASEGCTWNADDGGEYFPSSIAAAFEGPKGLELCYVHGAPESITVGMLYLRDGKLDRTEYECYHSLYDEELPVWKKDIVEMRKLYQQAAPSAYKSYQLNKWAHVYLDDNEWIRMHDSNDQCGAFFIRKEGKIQLVTVETPDRRPTKMEVGDVVYLRVSGASGDASILTEIFAFKGGKQIEHFTMKETYGQIEEAKLNGKTISCEQGGAYADRLPEGKEINTNWNEINEE